MRAIDVELELDLHAFRFLILFSRLRASVVPGPNPLPRSIEAAKKAAAKPDIREATDEQLQAALRNPRLWVWPSEEVFSEITRRKNQQETEARKPFNARIDVSADAKYLWRNVFIWFWLVPAAAVLVRIFVKSL